MNEIEILQKSTLVQELETSVPLIRAIIEQQPEGMDTKLARQLSSLFFRLFTYAEEEGVRHASWQLHQALESAHQQPTKEPMPGKTLDGRMIYEACCQIESFASHCEWETLKHGKQIAYNEVGHILSAQMRLCESCGKQQEPEHVHETNGWTICSTCLLRLRDEGVL